MANEQGEGQTFDTAEEARKAAWDRLAERMRGWAEAGTPAVLDARALALILAQVEGLEAHVYALADMAQNTVEANKATVGWANAELDRLQAERNKAFAQVTRLGEDCAKLKDERDEARAELEKAKADAQDARHAFQEFFGQLQQRADEAGARAERLTRDLGATRGELARALNDRLVMEHRLNDMAERFADLQETLGDGEGCGCDSGRGVVVIQLGVQIA